MLASDFLMELTDRYPRARLSDNQQRAFCADVNRFRLSMELVTAIADNCDKAFPSIADVAKYASRRASEDKPWLRAHVWQATECRFCGGEGRVALFGRFLYAANAEDSDLFEIEHAVPYHASLAIRQANRDLTEAMARCSCPAGQAPALGTGIPRWNGIFEHRSRWTPQAVQGVSR